MDKEQFGKVQKLFFDIIALENIVKNLNDDCYISSFEKKICKIEDELNEIIIKYYEDKLKKLEKEFKEL